MDIRSLDLGERAEPAAGIISVVSWPGVGWFLLLAAYEDRVFARKIQRVAEPAGDKRLISLQGHQVGREVMHLLIGILIQHLAMEEQFVFYLHRDALL